MIAVYYLFYLFLNLLSNSRDASPPNSAITILANSLDEKIRVTINDSGTGIAENLQSQLFEPFVTSKDPGKGTGLGLWVVFNLVKGLGAEITICTSGVNSISMFLLIFAIMFFYSVILSISILMGAII